MRRVWLGAMSALAGCLAIAVFASSASALVLPKNGHWCGIAVDQPLSGYWPGYFGNREPSYYPGHGCGWTENNFGFDAGSQDAVPVEFYVSRKYMYNMYVDDEYWIRSADVVHGRYFHASDNGHNVDGTFEHNWLADGTIELDGVTSYFYAVWVSR